LTSPVACGNYRHTYLAEEGIEYVSDWVNDDQPYEISTSRGPLVSVPYTLELNDIPMMIIRHHEWPAWVQRCRDQFDRLYAEGAKGRVMAIAVHPYIHGVPHRIKYFEAVYDYMRARRRACGSPPARRSTSGGRPVDALRAAPCLDFAGGVWDRRRQLAAETS
jgi:hypothetical protein